MVNDYLNELTFDSSQIKHQKKKKQTYLHGRAQSMMLPDEARIRSGLKIIGEPTARGPSRLIQEMSDN